MHLKSLNSLSSLNLLGTRVSDAGVKELKQALPGPEDHSFKKISMYGRNWWQTEWQF